MPYERNSDGNVIDQSLRNGVATDGDATERQSAYAKATVDKCD